MNRSHRGAAHPALSLALATALLASCASSGGGSAAAPATPSDTGPRVSPACNTPLPRSRPEPPAYTGRAPKGGGDPAVREAQEVLGRLGYECGTPDGRMGAKTRACIEKFQRDRALPVTGKPDSATLEAIRE